MLDHEVTEENFDLINSMSTVYRCPVDGHTIIGIEGDDKVICKCGKTNPALAARGIDETHAMAGGSLHYTKWLRIVTDVSELRSWRVG